MRQREAYKAHLEEADIVERRLQIAGKIFSVIYAFAAAALLAAAIFGTTLIHGAAATPAQVSRALEQSGFQEQLASAILSSLVADLPETLTVGNVTIPMRSLTASLLSADARTVANLIFTPDALRSIFASIFTNAASRVENRAFEGVLALQAQFEGQPVYEIARVILRTARLCSEQQQRDLEAAAARGDYSAIDFICDPSSMPDGTIRGLMEDALVVFLGRLGNILAERLQTVLANLEIGEISVETSMGRITLDWPYVIVGSGIFSLRIALPEALVEGVNNIQTGVQTSVNNAQNTVATSQANISGLATEVSGIVGTVSSPLATRTPTPAPTATPIVVTVPRISRITDATNQIIATVDLALTQTANEISAFIWTVIGVLVVHLLICALFALRAWPGLGLWVGAVLAATGLILLICGGSFVSQINAVPTTAYDRLPGIVAQFEMAVNQAISSTLRSEITAPLQTQGIALLVAGMALLSVTGYFIWRGGKKAKPVEVIEGGAAL